MWPPRIMSKALELLAPAGDTERLCMALHYGADAVYLAGRGFGMRSAAANFTDGALLSAVALAHEKNARVYVTCNTLPREDELALLPDYLAFLQEAGVDGLIVADLGVLALARRCAPKVPLHVSTQFGVTNSAAANALYALGADTVVLARELPLEEIKKIRANTPPELRLEAFVHGAMCISFSGRCLLSNYMTGRDANRGQCAQPCRWKYHLVEETRPGQYFEITQEDGGTHIMNAQDLRMIEHMPELIEAGISSFKIEGRMKSAYYTAAVTNAYRQALDAALEGRALDPLWVEETEKVSHRPYCTGFYLGRPGECYEGGYTSLADVAAVVESCAEDGSAVLTQRGKFCEGDRLELLLPGQRPIPFTARDMTGAEGERITDTRHAMMEIHMKLPARAEKYTIVRKMRS